MCIQSPDLVEKSIKITGLDIAEMLEVSHVVIVKLDLKALLCIAVTVMLELGLGVIVRFVSIVIIDFNPPAMLKRFIIVVFWRGGVVVVDLAVNLIIERLLILINDI